MWSYAVTTLICGAVVNTTIKHVSYGTTSNSKY